ncbi:hypothetical protein Golob_017604 [Gossypium lobatum]|uniref:NAC domain-containing protein n=2 Tax=Gossypium TaxID=3633 RepID=A0A7J8M7R7_9ROSI|nr:hypothetical protein [Gossypium lobatum]
MVYDDVDEERCRIGYEEQSEWYFFSHKDKKYPTGTRTNRATMAGFWKATGRDKAVYDKSKLIGMRKTLEEGWVVCRAFKKKTTGQTKSIDVWDSSYDEPSGISSVVDPLDYLSRQPQNLLPPSYLCKQETEAENLNFVHSDQFVQLPQLESPSLPLIKKPTSISLVPENNNNNTNHKEEEDHLLKIMCNNNNNEKVTDWRTLDKFVASQLSHEDRYHGEVAVSCFDAADNNTNNSDMALLLLQSSGREEANKLNEFLNSSSDCDIGICIFDK